MAIPETQLDTWSHQGAIQGSSGTYKTVKDVLEADGTPYGAKNYSVFLQGSYGNNTNIYAESDVDVVICLSDCFQSDRAALTPDQEAAWVSAHSDATYTHVDFKKDVLKVLKDAFGSDADAGKKAIMIKANGSRRDADVIAAINFRRYYKFNGINDQSYDEGICFYTSDGRQIANYPKQHRENLTAKHQASSGWLKPMVRIMKNMRSRLVDDDVIKAGLAPSYFIEGLLSNVPSDKFHTDYGTCFVNAINWIRSESDMDKLVCTNGQYYLLRDNVATCWPKANCDEYLDAVVQLWNSWD